MLANRSVLPRRLTLAFFSLVALLSPSSPLPRFIQWHKEGAYKHLTNAHDESMLPWIRRFNECDLYSKDSPTLDVESLRPYYQSLIAKFFPAELRW